ncbi:MAG: hypothetical protein OEU32_12505 [Acidimicrobiia bacterium]|nr:hypothetical protein [Acidimicrobiia bacterium]
MSGVPRHRVALDHNFPEPVVDALAPHILEAELIPIRRMDERLPRFEDHDLVVALDQLGVAALVTNNYKMLKVPRELAAIMATSLTVIAIEGLGDDPIRAAGALLLDLPPILAQLDANKAQIAWMRPR